MCVLECESSPTVEPPGTLWSKPYLQWHTEARKGWDTGLLASKWNEGRRKDVTVSTQTRTHTHHQPATLPLILSGSFVQQHGYLNLLEWNKRKQQEERKLLGKILWHDEMILPCSRALSCSKFWHPKEPVVLVENHPPLPCFVPLGTLLTAYMIWMLMLQLPSFAWLCTEHPEKVSYMPG